MFSPVAFTASSNLEDTDESSLPPFITSGQKNARTRVVTLPRNINIEQSTISLTHRDDDVNQLQFQRQYLLFVSAYLIAASSSTYPLPSPNDTTL
jgi:hypothetical protein